MAAVQERDGKIAISNRCRTSGTSSGNVSGPARLQHGAQPVGLGGDHRDAPT